MPALNTLNTWILRDNLYLFLERLSVRIRYRFEDWDWDAIRFGVRDTDIAQDSWYAYELNGTPSVKLAFAEGENAKRLNVSVVTETHMAARVEALARILQCYEQVADTQDLEILIEAAFIDAPVPDQSKIVGCSAAHLADCPECQEVLAFFKGKHWMTLLREGVLLPSPLGGTYAGFGFLTVEARHFFFPVYLVTAIRDKDKLLLENALDYIREELWTPLQQEIIEFARHLLQIESF